MSTRPQDDPTIGKLVADATRDLTSLVQHEIALAKKELTVTVRTSGIGVGLVAAAIFLLLLIVILASITVAYFLVMAGLHPAWAFLIVTGFYLLLAVLCGLGAWYMFKRVKAPKKTIETAKEISQAFKPGATPREVPEAVSKLN